MKRFTTTVVATVAMLALASPLYAAAEQKTTADTNPQADAFQSLSAEELKGLQVVSPSGEKIGKISDVKSDEQSGTIQFVTISRGGFLGIGGEDTAVSPEAFELDRENERATLTVSESMLDTAPQQANLSDQEFQRELASHYGVSPAWEQETDQGEVRIDRTQQPEVMMDAPHLQPPMDQAQQPSMEMDSSQMPPQEPAPQTN